MSLTTVPFRRARRFGIASLVGAVILFPRNLVALNVLGANRGTTGGTDQPQISIGPDVRADLVVYLKLGVTNDQINSVWDSVLSDPDPRGGHMPLPGIAGITRVTPADGHVAIAVGFRPTASYEAVASIRNRLGKCEYVFMVLEDVVPAEVKHLE